MPCILVIFKLFRVKNFGIVIPIIIQQTGSNLSKSMWIDSLKSQKGFKLTLQDFQSSFLQL